MTVTAFKIDAKILAYAPWAGGKRRLAKRIVELLGEHNEYREPFVGGCAILPQKKRSRHEWINDKNPELVNVLRCIRSTPNFSDSLSGLQFCREHFDDCHERLIEEPLKFDEIALNVEHAAAQLAVWWMGANGYAGTTKDGWFAQRFTKTGGDPSVRWNSFRRSISALSERLQDACITRVDFRHLVDPSADSRGLAIYADPPYFVKKIQYAHDFKPADHVDLARLLNQFRKARVVVSYYDDPLIPALYPPDRWERHEVAVSKASANARTGATKTTATEILLVNSRA